MLSPVLWISNRICLNATSNVNALGISRRYIIILLANSIILWTNEYIVRHTISPTIEFIFDSTGHTDCGGRQQTRFSIDTSRSANRGCIRMGILWTTKIEVSQTSNVTILCCFDSILVRDRHNNHQESIWPRRKIATHKMAYWSLMMTMKVRWASLRLMCPPLLPFNSQ